MMRILKLAACCILLAGCGQAGYRPVPGEVASSTEAGVKSPAANADGAADLPAIVVAADRKIIYTATIELLVERFDEVPQNVQAIVASHGGYVARSQIEGMPGRPRRGHWTVRIPVDRYEDFLASTRRLGEIRSITTDSQDVSEEYVDVEARIRNKKQAEERLLAHLKETTAKLDDILSVERELSRVREEIERMEGRLRYLKDRTSLTTVELIVDEVNQYEPKEAPTYSTRLSRAWQGSLETLVTVSQNTLLAIVYLAPWLAILLVVAIVVQAIRRRKKRPPKPADAGGEK